MPSLVDALHQVLQGSSIRYAKLSARLHESELSIRRLLNPKSSRVMAYWTAVMTGAGVTVVVTRGPRSVNIAGDRHVARSTKREGVVVSGILTTKQPSDDDLLADSQVIMRDLLPRRVEPIADLVTPFYSFYAALMEAKRPRVAMHAIDLCAHLPARRARHLFSAVGINTIRTFSRAMTALGVSITLTATRPRRAGWILSTDDADPTCLEDVSHGGPRRGAPSKPRISLGKAVVLSSLLSNKDLEARLAAAAQLAGVPESTVRRWKRDGQDYQWEVLEVLTNVLGGQIQLTGALDMVVTPLSPNPQRLAMVSRQAASIYRSVPGHRTSTHLATTVAHLKDSIANLVPSKPMHSMVAFIRHRVAQLAQQQADAILPLALISGLPRPAIARVLHETTFIDAPYVRCLGRLGVHLEITCSSVR